MTGSGKSAHWGGKRTGAGRPKSPNVTVRLSIPREVWAMVQADAERSGHSAETEAVRVLTDHVTAPLFRK
ncbi:hypothetical protein [Deinococcus radiophilus]|uniref:CopG-like ribbon-helix-helix domain-containing protein n=1 Tax=Deinococcus radiophilus TaxID=32062 RepID=A0A431VQ39_9DEIO|nr:hypothetical protein [Deinococcus radiophilus]RTR25301.1 hypothetical protein EJ104_11390 [Deinococcus radiophilus]UFA52050.1 hypothetical protein LMT64_14085 [Deinococcus radiophilus]